MAKILIIGYGNPLRGDDALGWEAAQRLQEHEEELGAEAIAAHQLTPELAEAASEAECVIFVDASIRGKAGQVEVMEVRAAQKPPASFSHHFTPDVLLACAATLYGASPKAYLVSAAGESFEYGQGMSEVIQQALPAVVERVRELIAQIRRR